MAGVWLVTFWNIVHHSITHIAISCFVMFDAVWLCSGQMKDENKLLQQKLRAMLRQKEPTVSMSELVRTEQKEAIDTGDDVFVEQLDVSQSSKFVANDLFDWLNYWHITVLYITLKNNGIMLHKCSYKITGGSKTEHFWELITLWWSLLESRVIANFAVKSIKLHVNILCLICINIHCIWNYAEFDNSALFYSVFAQINIQWNNTYHWHTGLVHMKFSMGTLDLDNHHQSFGSWSILTLDLSPSLCCRSTGSTVSPFRVIPC